MTRLLSSTQRQVTAILAFSLILSHALVILSVVFVFDDRERRVPPHLSAALQMAASLSIAQPGQRLQVLRAASEAGIPVSLVPDAVREACGASADAAQAKPVRCRDPRTGFGAVARAGDVWLGMPVRLMAWPPPRPWILFYGLITVIGLPTLMLSFWASRRVTAPLRTLAAAADGIEADGAGVVLPVQGTSEIRLLAHSFNRLILRLQDFAAGQRRMVAAISHDLRTPLTRLRLRLDQVADEMLRAKLVRDIDTMQMIVESSLSLGRAQHGAFAMHKVDLGVLLQTVVDELADAGNHVSLDGPAHLALRCEPAMLTRAFENLLENAAKFAGGAQVTLAATDREAVIDIVDHGPGIADAEKQLVLQPYYRGDKSRGGVGGTGLGLSIAQSVVAAHGGRLALLDAQPHGLHVKVTIPLQAPGASSDRMESSAG